MPEKTSLKIVHVLLSRGFAGSERSTAESCNEQVKKNDVTLVIRKGHRKRGASIVDHLDTRVKVIEISARLLTRYQLASVLEKIRADVVHCHLRRSTRLVAKIAPKISQVSPKMATVSTLHIEVNGVHFLSMDGLICNARWQVEKVPSTYQGKLFKASNSLVPHRRLDEEEVSNLRTDLGVMPDDFLIGAVGRYHESKAWDTLIPAFTRLSGDTAQLLFFGSGRLESELKALVGTDQRIRFLGFRANIKDLYQCFDLVVCPSRYEPLPRVMLEAMDAGTPVLASDTGGCKELIDDYGGFLFPVDNQEALYQKLNSLMTSRPSRRRPDLSAHYVENANAAIVDFYRELIESKST